MNKTVYYRVMSVKGKIPDYHEYGYDNENSFYEGLLRLEGLYKGRIGKCVDKRHVFVRLMFTDTPDRQPVYEWFPLFMLQMTPEPKTGKRNGNPTEEIDTAFGF